MSDEQTWRLARAIYQTQISLHSQTTWDLPPSQGGENQECRDMYYKRAEKIINKLIDPTFTGGVL